jgi:hypothetical protein
MTNAYQRTTLLAAILAGTALVTAGCGDRQPGQTVGQKMDRATDKVATATERAATKTGVAVEDATITTKCVSRMC